MADLNARLATITPQLPPVERTYTDFLQATNPQKKEALREELVRSLQPLGAWLDSADPNYQESFTLSADQARYLQQQEALNPRPAKNTENTLELLTPEEQYTLLNVPMPIVLKAPRGSSVFFIAHNGGEFANGLSRLQLETDQDGFARTYWLSRGNAISGADISIISPSCSNEQNIHFQVKRLALAKFPMLELAKTNANITGAEQQLQLQHKKAQELLQKTTVTPPQDSK